MTSSKIREAFEHWVRTNERFKFDDVSLDRDEYGYYLECRAEEMFVSWKAALHSVEAAKPNPVGHFYFRTTEGRVGVEWCCDHLDDGAALYAEPVGVEAEKEPEWLDINSAPKDRHILGCQSRHGIMRVVRGPIDEFGNWSTGPSSMDFLAEVTHWMELPAPPEHKPE